MHLQHKFVIEWEGFLPSGNPRINRDNVPVERATRVRCTGFFNIVARSRDEAVSHFRRAFPDDCITAIR